MLTVPETGKARGSQGEQLWMGENLPEGAIITYWLKDAARTRRQQRQDAARAAEQKKETPRYPTQEELTAEADEEAPQTLMTITDAAGKVVRRLAVPGDARHPSLQLEPARRADHDRRRAAGLAAAVAAVVAVRPTTMMMMRRRSRAEPAAARSCRLALTRCRYSVASAAC